ncbi:fluoride efflux transporter CrcB [Termitidicoccus mucosus]|uniref:Fluoride-specific ion channel FluC n=1 Tax=Termitidicoccus mucosus TaxID=1184151 RepID=A0A178IK11_9BACT|nr:camphor resistance protein CrcB [Opitutaceae bacterium TSB47]OAM90872.1 camphor resistance protein CrcB [Opitutaceae bacterium TSB47]
MSLYFWIFFGSGLGGVARFALSGLIAHRFGETFPWGTFVINISGSFLIGFIAQFTAPEGRLLVSGTVRQFLMTGIIGGYTTYSSFSLQTLALARDGEWFRTGANALGTFTLCFLAVWLGHLCAAWLDTMKGS